MHIKRSTQPSPSFTESAIRGDARGLRIAIAVSAYHEAITGAMRDAAIETFTGAGGARDDIEVIQVPGAFELIAAASALADVGAFDAIVALGCIITGETTHDQHIANAVATGLAKIIVETGVPISFGVLTCRSIEQAKERAGGSKGNKGEEAMHAAIATARTLDFIRDPDGVAP